MQNHPSALTFEENNVGCLKTTDIPPRNTIRFKTRMKSFRMSICEITSLSGLVTKVLMSFRSTLEMIFMKSWSTIVKGRIESYLPSDEFACMNHIFFIF